MKYLEASYQITWPFAAGVMAGTALWGAVLMDIVPVLVFGCLSLMLLGFAIARAGGYGQ